MMPGLCRERIRCKLLREKREGWLRGPATSIFYTSTSAPPVSITKVVTGELQWVQAGGNILID